MTYRSDTECAKACQGKKNVITAHNQEMRTNKIFVLLIDCGKWPSFRGWKLLGEREHGNQSVKNR